MVELSWLLTRGYAEKAALKLVGDRYQLTRRQRYAVGTCACSDEWLDKRLRTQLRARPDDLAGRALRVDGFNVLITLEAALSGALVLIGRDGVRRDLSRQKRAYRTVRQTRPAAVLVGERLAACGVRSVDWCLDRPKSNSGRLATLLREVAEAHAWPWEVRLTDGTDRLVADAPDVAVSSDSWILDNAAAWVDLAGAIVAVRHDIWRLDLRT